MSDAGEIRVSAGIWGVGLTMEADGRTITITLAPDVARALGSQLLHGATVVDDGQLRARVEVSDKVKVSQ